MDVDLLPLEIIITIFEYLPISDIKNASITCKKWLNASMHSSVMDRRQLILRNTNYLNEDECEEYQLNLVKPILSYNSVKIVYEDDSESDSVNLILLRNIFECLNQFENLISLTISFFTEDPYQKCLNKTAEYLSDQSFVQLNSMKIFKIDLHDGDNRTSCYLPYFLDVMPELVHLDIRLKLNWVKTNPCQCSRQQLFDYLNKGKKRIKTLLLYADDETNNLISSIEGMNLETLEIPNFVAFSKFTDRNKLLHISLTKDIYSLDSVCDYFPNIETISVDEMTNMRGIEKLTKLKNLHGARIYDQAIDNLSVHGSKILENLWLENQRSSNLLSFKNLLNLTHLTCSSIQLGDAQMQEICSNLKQLKHIALKGSMEEDTNLTDYGFTGERENSQTGCSISNLTELKVLHIQIVDSCLGDPTLRHIMKMKGLEYLYISCQEDSVKDYKSTLTEFEEKIPFLQAEITFDAGYIGFYTNTRKKINKLFPFTRFMENQYSR